MNKMCAPLFFESIRHAIQDFGAAKDPLDRRRDGGQLLRLGNTYQLRKSQALEPLLRRVVAERKFDPTWIAEAQFALFDERVVEYPFVLDALLKLDPLCSHVLDIGCVLNNKIIAGYCSKQAAAMWLMNPVFEPPVNKDRTIFVLSDVRETPIPDTLQFDLVTSLSTLEHVGMDNTRYGGEGAEFKGEIPDPERYAIQGLRSIARYARPGGRLLVSLPFGPFEYLYVFQEPGKPIYYTLDKPRVLAMTAALEQFEVKTYVYKVVPGTGWIETTLTDDQNILRHADKCAAAGGVVFIDAIRR